MICFHGIRHLLLDIEGTTCPVSFVNEVLFPYASKQLLPFLMAHRNESRIQKILEEVQSTMPDQRPKEIITSLELGAPPIDPSEIRLEIIAAYLAELIQGDRKMTALKDLQGMIWEEGYQQGDIMAPLFSDVPNALRRWHTEGIQLSVYSSGSVQAQRLLYTHTRQGDLSHVFSHWFDTHTGAKSDPSSYKKIAEACGANHEELLFISDSTTELDAAQETKIHTLFSLRPGNPDQDPRSHPPIESFNDLQLESNK